MRDTRVGHKGAARSSITPSNRSDNRPQLWVTRLGHKRSVRGLSLRGSIYHFRVRVPVDLRDTFGSSHVKRSLGTDSLSLAIRLARRAAFEIDAMFEAKRRQIGLDYDARLIADQDSVATVRTMIGQRSGPASASVDPASVDQSDVPTLTLSTIYQRFLNDPTKRRSARTMLAHHTTRRVIEDVLGGETPLHEISREACRELLELLRWLPVNHSKKFGKLTVREAAAMAKADRRIKTINTTNLNAYMSRFATMMNWAVSEEYISRNPSRGLQLADTILPQDRRKPFELWQLQRIFSAPIYTGCKDGGSGYAKPGSQVASGARYWVPLIGLFSGMRLNEACQMDVADVRLLDDIPCFVISKDSLVGSRDKSLKTKSSARIVPVHPSLVDLGFMGFVVRKRREGATKLFDDLPVGAKGFRSIAFSRWFSRFLVSAKANASRTCFHSFRHGFRDAARNAGIDRDVALRLGGWITGGAHSETADDYGSGYRPAVLFEAMARIEYPGLDLSHLSR
ncbi:MAG: site-specific integrase [Sphingomonadaceae bacterium]